MAVYSIVKIGDPGDSVLREKASTVKKITPSIFKLLDNLKDTLYEANGVGLAAPQIGISKRVVVIDVGEGLLELINPEIIEYSDETELDVEGCLSIPGARGEVERYSSVVVKALNREGEEIEIAGEGLLSRCLQHEIDHLYGVLYIDRATRMLE
ncbi:MAG TPA: peptide deformylase [Clostridia bacterium]|jgi:peptide deformylase|nr:peptide deformylase [Clostridia bacterium]